MEYARDNPITLCAWAMHGNYRGKECNYTGTQLFDINNKETDDPKQDGCRGNFESCCLRKNICNFGGYPEIVLFE